MASKTLLVPNKLSDITIGQYQKFAKISTDKVDKDFLEKKMIEIFCHVELKDVNNIKYSSIKKVVNILNKMFEVKPKLISTFKMNDKEYGMIPKIDDITFGEYVDIDSTISDWDSVDKAMSVLYRPIKYKKGKRYLIEDYDSDNENYMDKMPLDVALGALFFLVPVPIEEPASGDFHLFHVHLCLECEEYETLRSGNMETLALGLSNNPP